MYNLLKLYGAYARKNRLDTSLVQTSAKQFVATTSQYGLLFELGNYSGNIQASDSSRLTGPSKNSPPSPLSERPDHKGDFLGLLIKTEFSGVNSGASRPYRSGFLNTWHLLFSSPRGSQVWKGDKVLIVPFLLSFSTEVGGIEVKPLAFEDASLVTLYCRGVSPLVSND